MTANIHPLDSIGDVVDTDCDKCGKWSTLTVSAEGYVCNPCGGPYAPPEITPDMLLKWAGYVPPAPKGMASEHVFTGEVTGWTERTVPAEPAPKLCKRCAALLTDGKHCPVNPRHNRKPKVTARRDTLAGFQPDAETVIRQSIAPKVAPAHSPVVAAGRTVVTVRKGKSEAEFAPPAKSGKTQGFSPLPNPVYNPVTPTSAQSAANRAARDLAGSVVTREQPNRVIVTDKRGGKVRKVKVATGNAPRFNAPIAGLARNNASCSTCGSIRTDKGECASVAWHMTALDT